MSRKDYEVGYGKPPPKDQFKKGRSGNPRGRPRGSRSLAEEIRRLLQQRVAITENGKRRQITALEAVLRRLLERALKGGDLAAIARLLALAEAYAPPAPARPELDTEERALIKEALELLRDEEDRDDKEG